MHNSTEHIAIIGMTGRFPGAAGIDEFWSNLAAGVESIRTLSKTELQAAGVDPALAANPRYVPRGGFIEDREYFDARFFGYSPREAEITDPQHRVFLECAWEVLEAAGYDSATFPGRIGILASSTTRAWELHVLSNAEVARSLTSVQIAGIAGATDHLATRTAFKLNLSGPAASIQTSCSSSLVAVCFACQSLLDRKCEMIIAGGVSVMYRQIGYLYEDSGVASPDGHCRVFDAEARGTVAGEGVGAVLLKRLSDAIADRDRIRAVIRGWAVNNDGSSKMSYAAPSVQGQAAAVAEAHRLADADAGTIGYLEAHGTGTRIGDPIEVAALTQAFRQRTPRRAFCAIGSVKANIGHLDAAAGIAGLIKTALILEHGVIPASLYYRDPNPEIDFPSTPFYVTRETHAWTHEQRPRRAGVSSFGIGGTNAHLVLEEAPENRQVVDGCGACALLPLSAKTSTARRRAMSRLAAHLRAHPDICLDDAAYTLQIGRRAFPYRCAVVASNPAEAATSLEVAETGAAGVHGQAGPRPANLGFVFLSNPVAFAEPWQQLFAMQPVFRKEVERCFDILEERFGMRLREDFTTDAAALSRRLAAGEPLASFIYQHALARLWKSKGMHPAMVIGEGAGIFAAAQVADIFELEDALHLALRYDREAGSERACLDKSFARAAAAAAKRGATIPLNAGGCTLSGTPEEVFSPDYWKRLLGPPCAFSECVQSLIQRSDTVLLAMSPRGTVYESEGVRGFTDTAVCDDLSLLELIGRLWVRGVPVDWARLHVGDRRRVPLPTYPFERQRFWIESGSVQFQQASSPVPAPRVNFSVPVWRHSIEPAACSPSQSTARSWLILAHEEDFSPSFANHIRQAGGRAITVSFDGNSRADFNIGSSQPDDFAGLASRLLVAGEIPAFVLYVGNFSRAAMNGAGTRAFFDLVYFLQGLHREELRPTPRTLLVLSSHSQQVTGNDTLDPARAVVHGLSEAVREEYPHLNLRFVDAAYPKTVHDTEQLIEQILWEANRSNEDSIAAYRGSRRWTAEYEGIQLPANGEPLLPPHGVCLIVGGLGGVGLTVAEHLARQSHAKLALTCASPFPRREEWPDWLNNHEPRNKTSVRVRKLMDIESAGGEVLASNVDASDLESMRQFLLQVRQSLGPITGVIHASGVPGGKVIQMLTAAHIEAVWRPKIQALRVLRTILDDEPKLEWIVLFSSLMAVAGGLGRADYAAANSYLDACAQQQLGGSKVKIVSINWDTWARTGMSSAASRDDADAESETPGLNPAEALQALADVLRSGLPQVIVSEHELPELLKLRKKSRSLARLEGHLTETSARRKNSIAPSADPALLEEMMTSLWQELLGVSPISRDDNFFELGGDSVVGLQLAARVHDFGFQLAPRDIFTAPTIAELVNSVKPIAGAAVSSAPASANPATSVAPELLLKEVWEDLLGVASVGMNDDFFELGGDSVVGLQIAARLRELGYRLNPRDIFESPVLSDLAKLVQPLEDSSMMATPPEVVPVTPAGFPLSPIQQWFFELPLRNRNHFNQSVFLDVGFDPFLTAVAESVRLVVKRHGMLSAHFAREADRWQQHLAPSLKSRHLAHIDVASVNESRLGTLVESIAAATQGALHLERGPVFRAVLFDRGRGRTARLLLVAHHLVIDAASWSVLLEELQTAYAAALPGSSNSANPVLLRPAPLPYSAWVARLPQMLATAESNVSYWRDIVQAPVLPLPRDFSGRNLAGELCVFETRLDTAETTRLARELPQRFRTSLETVLLAAAGLAFAGWARQPLLRLDVERSARDSAPAGLDLSRTIGWFTILHPVLLNIPAGSALSDVVEGLETEMGHSGLEYGLLRYVSENSEIRAVLRPALEVEISFVYLGAGSVPHSAFGPAPESSGPATGPDEPRAHLIDIVADINSGQLRLAWLYSRSIHRSATIQLLAESTVNILRSALCTPAPMHCGFPESDLSGTELQSVLKELGQQ